LSLIDNFLAKRGEGASSNENAEMSFTDHLEQLRWHLFRSIIAILVAAIVVFINIEWIFSNIVLGPAKPNFLSYRVLCQLADIWNTPALCLEEIKLAFQSTQLTGQFMISFSSSLMIGFIVAFPYVFWEMWRFVKPALKKSELKLARGIVFWASILFFLGVLFSYYVIVPFTINFFANYQLSEQFQNIITIDNYYDTLFDIILGMGVVFQLPISIYFLSRLGIVTPQLLRDKRRFAIMLIVILSAFISPPDVFSLFFIAVPLCLLYEVGIMISVRVSKKAGLPTKEVKKLDW
jgi:sec-independent protein translocase protein TatC